MAGADGTGAAPIPERAAWDSLAYEEQHAVRCAWARWDGPAEQLADAWPAILAGEVPGGFSQADTASLAEIAGRAASPLRRADGWYTATAMLLERVPISPQRDRAALMLADAANIVPPSFAERAAAAAASAALSASAGLAAQFLADLYAAIAADYGLVRAAAEGCPWAFGYQQRVYSVR